MTTPFKICDSVHGFIRFEEPIRQVIDSQAFQRLRYIRQMGMAYLIYPGAIHTRFEHSLGVMELATRIYNTLIESHHQIISLPDVEELDYWRLILRLAALCHDMGHLPFSHTAEKELLPDGGHEEMSLRMIQSKELSSIWSQIGPHAEEDIIKLAVTGHGFEMSPWEKVLSQVITEDNFGADRIDYLIRDTQYTGTRYGHFDYHQLIDSLRILPNQEELSIGVMESGIQSVESLWIARYMMYARVYQLPKTSIYSYHMKRAMARIGIPTSLDEYLEQTDYTMLTALSKAAKEGDYDAQCILKLARPFQEVSLDPIDEKALKAEFGEQVWIDHVPQKIGCREFPVYTDEKQVISSAEASPFLSNIPPGGKSQRVYVHPDIVEKVKQGQREFAEPVH